jgi:hypothetical protein
VGGAPACYGSSLDSNPDIQKYKMGDISKGGANKLSPAKKNTKKYIVHCTEKSVKTETQPGMEKRLSFFWPNG